MILRWISWWFSGDSQLIEQVRGKTKSVAPRLNGSLPVSSGKVTVFFSWLSCDWTSLFYFKKTSQGRASIIKCLHFPFWHGETSGFRRKLDLHTSPHMYCSWMESNQNENLYRSSSTSSLSSLFRSHAHKKKNVFHDRSGRDVRQKVREFLYITKS